MNNLWRVSLCFVIFSGLMLKASASENAPQELVVYPIGFADGPNSVEVIKSVLGNDIHVVYDRISRKLLVLASSNQHAAVAMLVKQMDVPLKNVSVTVTFKRTDDRDHASSSLTGGGQVIRTPQGGMRTTVRLTPSLVNQQSEMTSSAKQQLLVSSGKQASLAVGEEVPYIDWLMEYGFHNRIITQRVNWQRVGSFLVIEPTIIGEGPMIRVKLTPELSGLVDNSPYRTRFDTVSTEVIVSDGIPFTLGGAGQNQEFYSRFLIGVDRSGKRENLNIEMTARILSPENQ